MTDPGHLIFNYNVSGTFVPDHTMIFLIFLPIFMFFETFVTIMRFVCYKVGCWKQLKGTDMNWNFDIAVNENLGNYWNSLRGS